MDMKNPVHPGQLDLQHFVRRLCERRGHYSARPRLDGRTGFDRQDIGAAFDLQLREGY